MADLSPEMEACVDAKLNRMFETGEIGDLTASGMTFEQIVDIVIQECQKTISVGGDTSNIEIGGSNVYVKRSTTIVIAVASGVVGAALGALVMHLSMGD